MNYSIRLLECKPQRALSEFDPAEFIFTSWSRALTGARPEHKLKIFGEMAKDARRYAGGHCQVIDDLLVVADKSGLTDLVGDVCVQDAIRAAFGGSVS
jgi:hypothetical protein